LTVFAQDGDDGSEDGGSEGEELVDGDSDGDGSGDDVGDSDDVFVLGGIKPEGVLNSESVYVVNTDTRIPVYAKNETKKMVPASTAKIMTALITLEKVKNLDERLTVASVCLDEFHSGDPNKTDVATAGTVFAQDNLSYRDCLYGLMLYSGCETANILAYNVGGGDMEEFYAMMNARAAEIGCVNSNFANAHGLYQPDNWSCAYDMYLIAQYAIDNFPLFSEIVRKSEYMMPPIPAEPEGYVIDNRNMLLRGDPKNPYYYEFATGIKTGSIDYFYDRDSTVGWKRSEGGTACLVSSATRDEYSYIVVTMGAPYYYHVTYIDEAGNNLKALHNAYLDHQMLYRWAFSTFAYRRVLPANEPVGSVKVAEGQDASEINIFPKMEADFWTLLPKTLDIESAILYIIDAEEETTAPVGKGDVFGSIELKLANKSLGKWQLVTQSGVERSQAAERIEKVNNVLGQWWFKPLVALLALLIITLIVLNSLRRVQRERKKKRHNKRIRR
jgi:D-alanyl-D-alanine carboxypeptidase (penicillin-binding protein 5/6)